MSDSTTNAAEAKQTTWQDIVLDLFILMLIMSAIGFILKFAMDACAVKQPIENLTATIRKGDVDAKTNKDAGFLTELANGQKDHPGFVNLKDDTGRTPLMWASYANSISPAEVDKIDLQRIYYVRTLLAQPGIEVQVTDEDGFSALHWAAWSGLEGVSLELIAAGLDLNAPEKNGYTPLMLAAMRGQAATVSMLLSLGADASAVNAEGKTALELASSHEKAYAASESGLYAWGVRAYCSLAFWMDDAEKEKKLGHTKAALFYIPIYESARSDAHDECVKLLQAPPAAATMEELKAKLAEREEAARQKRLKEEKKEAEGEAPAPEQPLPAEDSPELQVPAAGVAEEPQTA